MEKFQSIIEHIEKLTVVELAELIHVLEERFGVSAAAPVAAGGGAAAAAEAKTDFNVVLKAAGDKKIEIIKVVREITGLGLKEAKDLVDGAPKTIKESVKQSDADEMKKKLEAAGATVSLE